MWLRKPTQKAQALCRHKLREEVASDSSAGLELLPQIDGADTAAERQTLLYSLVLLCSGIGIKFWAHEGSIWFTQAEKEDIPTTIAMFCGL